MLPFEKISKNQYKIIINRGFGFSMGNMIDILSGKALESLKEENWIVVNRSGGCFRVVENNMTEKGDCYSDCTDLGFTEWDDEVQSLDDKSDEYQCFKMSNKLQWNDVILEPYYFKASSIKRLCEALEHITICAWCPGDI